MWYAIVRAGIEHGQVLFHAEYCFYVKIIEKIIQNSDRAAPDHPVVRLGIERRHVVCAGAHLHEGVWSFSVGSRALAASPRLLCPPYFAA